MKETKAKARKAKSPDDARDDAREPTPFEKMKRLTRAVVRVPKTEVDARRKRDP
jgi:hypothetical protein